MSGGVGSDPYYQKDPPKKKAEKKKAEKKEDSQGVPETGSSTPPKVSKPQDLRRLYFEEGLTIARMARKLGVSPRDIWRAFHENGWEPTTGRSLDDDIHRLYFHERLSKSEIARMLGIERKFVEKAFQRNHWKSIPPPTAADPEQARKLYEQGLSQREVAKKLGVLPACVAGYLKQLGVKATRGRKYSTDEERLQGRREAGRRGLKKVRDMRNRIFGTTCRLCGADESKRKLPIHKKDCAEHDYDDLWKPSFLRSLNPEDWARTCTMCHRGAHWAHDELGIDWPTLENLSREKRSEESGSGSSTELTPSNTQPSSRNNFPVPDPNRTVEDMRKELFGDECFFCGPLPEDKRLAIHRKDGAKHAKGLLKSREYLQQLNPEEWVPVCQKHHRYVHWARDHLGLEWDDIESMFRNER